MRLIDAEKLAEVLNRYLEAPHVQLRNSGISVGLRMGINTCLTFLNNANTIEAEPVKKGMWETNSDRPDSLICSICKCGFDMWKHDPHNYCPNCGADMRGEEVGNAKMESEE